MANKKESETEQTEKYADLYSIPRSTIDEIKNQIVLTWKKNQHRGAILVIGDAGVGKSQLCGQLSREYGATICDVRTAHWGLMSAGIPSTKNQEKDFFDIILPSVFPKPGKKAILVFDEINQGLQHAISMFFSLIEDRRMFNYVLPDDCLVIGLMNPNTALYSVTQIETNMALRRRLKMFYAIPSYEVWKRHAKTDEFHQTDILSLGTPKPCHPLLMKFYEKHPRMFYDFKAQSQHKQYACPATIQTISLDLYLMQQEGIPLTGDFSRIRLAASIGLPHTEQLITFLKEEDKSLDPSDILFNFDKVQDEVTDLINSGRQEVLHEAIQGVLMMLFSDQPKVNDVAKNFVYFLKTLTPDMAMAIFTQLNTIAKENNATAYRQSLMIAMNKFPEWIEIHKRADEGQKRVDSGLKGY
jgi:hypothetical protein